jgi:NSS family neurotransmitter:Na+ symporter
MPGGAWVGSAFFIMILFAALTSSLSMLETMTARAAEKSGVSRASAATVIGICTFLLGLVTVFSFSSWANYYPLGGFETFAGKTPFDLIDYFVSNLLLPVGGMLYALFAGWILRREVQVDELGVGDSWLYKLWLLLTRYVAPLAVGAVLIANL